MKNNFSRHFVHRKIADEQSANRIFVAGRRSEKTFWTTAATQANLMQLAGYSNEEIHTFLRSLGDALWGKENEDDDDDFSQKQEA